MASMQNCEGVPDARLTPSATHQVSGAKVTMCSFPAASITYFRRQPAATKPVWMFPSDNEAFEERTCEPRDLHHPLARRRFA
jgi:hypothetical protein